MKRTKETVLFAIVATFLFAGTASTFFSCKKNLFESDIRTSVEKYSSEQHNRPYGGFSYIAENEAKETTTILMGIAPEESINTKVYVKDSIISENDILYTFSDDLDSIWITNQSLTGFDITAFGKTYNVYDFHNINGGIICKLKSPKGNVITQTMYHDSIEAQSLLKLITQIDVLENPFIGLELNDKALNPSWLKKLIKVGGRAFVALSLASIAADIIEQQCQASLDADKYNCEQANKCIEKSGLCHYKYISCPR